MSGNDEYQMFKLVNREFTFDVDVSQLPCGINGAFYFSQMPHDGGLNEFSGNNAGANYGTGYCDAQCPRDIKFINGEANSEGWHGSPSDPNAGTGKYGACCMEFDIWEANSISQAFTAHPCSNDSAMRCDTSAGNDCGNTDRYSGVCDRDGCDFATFRNGDETFYGPGGNFQVDTTMPFTVVTQFITDDGTDNGTVNEIRRKYVQGGKVIETPSTTINGQQYNSLSDDFCSAVKQDFQDVDQFTAKGGISQMSKAFEDGMVLVLSIWDDHDVDMLWLDSTYPVGSTKKGSKRGTCSTDSGKPDDVENNSPNSSVTFSNIRFGTIGSTINAGDVAFTQ
jgi:cellulose 1,4-beta-cellobiosidase